MRANYENSGMPASLGIIFIFMIQKVEGITSVESVYLIWKNRFWCSNVGGPDTLL